MTLTLVAPVEAGQTQSAWTTPKNFHELFAQDPAYIERWLRSKHCPVDLLEDFTQDLYVHLMTVGKTDAERGFEDRVATYTPDLCGGQTIRNPRGSWGAYMDVIMIREYSKMLKRNERPGTRGPLVVSLSENVSDTCEGGSTNMFATLAGLLPLNAFEELRPQLVQEDDLTTKLFVGKFLAFVEEENPNLAAAARVIMYSESLTEALESLGCSRGLYSKMREQLRDQAKCYLRRRRRRLRSKR